MKNIIYDDDDGCEHSTARTLFMEENNDGFNAIIDPYRTQFSI